LLPPTVAETPLSNYTANATASAKQNSAVIPFPGKLGKMWECPSARMSDSDLASLSGGGAQGFFSYVMNIDLKHQQAGYTTSADYAYPGMPRLGDIRKPTVTVLMLDSIFNSSEGFSAGNTFYSVNPAARWRAFPSRHSQNGGILNFFDGHASYMKQSIVMGCGTLSGGAQEYAGAPLIFNPAYREVHP
ncbi:MAG: hypothetical protein JWR26_1559, partial [Pedosphaera sp.]|nr:hypothetical protein [Pedosphaera sp.]